MQASTAGPRLGQPMTWEQYWELPSELRAEFVDGMVYVNPPASFDHQDVCQRLRDAVAAAFGKRCVIAVAVGWRLPTHRRILRVPDLMLLTSRPDGDVVTGAVPVVVEVLSTNRRNDLVLKATEYLDAGVGQYWVVDRRDREFDVFANTPEGWNELAHLTDDAPSATIAVAPFGEITLLLSDIFG